MRQHVSPSQHSTTPPTDAVFSRAVAPILLEIRDSQNLAKL